MRVPYLWCVSCMANTFPALCVCSCTYLLTRRSPCLLLNRKPPSLFVHTRRRLSGCMKFGDRSVASLEHDDWSTLESNDGFQFSYFPVARTNCSGANALEFGRQILGKTKSIFQYCIMVNRSLRTRDIKVPYALHATSRYINILLFT